MKIFNFLPIGTSAYLLIGTLLLASCAQIVPPSGGKKDTSAPKAVKYIPDSAQLNFNSKNIMIEFNEFAELKDLNNQLVISPLLEKTPDISLKNKTLTISFDKNEKLKPNTTYCINFGNSIQDITENNPINNFKYIFSTGNFIDSLSISGSIKSAFDNKKEKEMLVMLYSNASDSIVFKNKPDYFTKTNAEGFFEINNIREGKYKLFALKDVSPNYKYDSEVEAIAFSDTLITIPNNNKLNLEYFLEQPAKIKLKKHYHSQHGKISLFFNRGSDSIRVNLLNNTQKGVQEYFDFSKNKDTLHYWVKNFISDSLFLQVNNGNTILDTVKLEMISLEKAMKNARTPYKFGATKNPDGNQTFDINQTIKIELNSIINEFKKEDIIIKTDSVISSDSWVIEKNNLSEIVFKPIDAKTKNEKLLKENTSYEIIIPPGCITDIYGLKNDSIKIRIKTREQKYYGTLKFTVNMPNIKGNYIVQLLDEKETVLRENSINKSEVLYYEYLLPMKYKVKIIKDINSNGKWDTGNYLKHTQPEKTIYFPELIQIRSNWDADQEWKIEK